MIFAVVRASFTCNGANRYADGRQGRGPLARVRPDPLAGRNGGVMTGGQRMVFRLLPLLAAVPIFDATANGQSAHVDPYQNGAAPAFGGRGRRSAAATAQQQAAAASNAAAAQQYANTLAADPMTPMLMYGYGVMGMPMTRNQAGLSAISSIQQCPGSARAGSAGCGEGAEAIQRRPRTRETRTSSAARRRVTSTAIEPRRRGAVVPVATTAAPANSRKFYQRQSRYFPQPAR